MLPLDYFGGVDVMMFLICHFLLDYFFFRHRVRVFSSSGVEIPNKDDVSFR